MEFKDLLDLYLDNLDKIKIYETNNKYSKEYLEGYYSGIKETYKNSKRYFEDVIVIRRPNEKEEKEYQLKEGDIIYDLFELIEYRDNLIPVYLDDYGQQLFCKIKDIEIPGGSFSTNPEIYFTDCYDEIVDNEKFDFMKGGKK